MSLALNYCWKEWRAQRGLLVAYTLLVFACLCLGLYLAPRHYWFDDAFGVHALSWFVAAGVIGVVAFVVPGLVRAEFASKADQFVRRLPGALWPAFWGKLLFLVLALLLMPLLGLLAGELFVTSLNQSWEGLFQWQWDGSVTWIMPTVIYYCAPALLLMSMSGSGHASISALRPSSVDTSACTMVTSPPAARISSAVASRVSSVRPLI